MDDEGPAPEGRSTLDRRALAAHAARLGEAHYAALGYDVSPPPGRGCAFVAEKGDRRLRVEVKWTSQRVPRFGYWRVDLRSRRGDPGGVRPFDALFLATPGGCYLIASEALGDRLPAHVTVFPAWERYRVETPTEEANAAVPLPGVPSVADGSPRRYAPRLTDDQRKAVAALTDAGLTVARIAARLGVTPRAVTRERHRQKYRDRSKNRGVIKTDLSGRSRKATAETERDAGEKDL